MQRLRSGVYRAAGLEAAGFLEAVVATIANDDVVEDVYPEEDVCAEDNCVAATTYMRASSYKELQY